MEQLALDAVAKIIHKPLGEKGEDAYCWDISRPDAHTFAVFDGCGGAGAWKDPEYMNATGAFVAAQKAAKNHLSWFRTFSPADVESPQILSQIYGRSCLQFLRQLKNECSPMGISGTLPKSFPCTASAALVTRGANDTILLTAMNAGDSRVFYLTPGGLVQLTWDDLRKNPDPLENLMQNAPLSNMLNADVPFSVKIRQVLIKQPCAVLCATDGVFGYVRSPMHFEYMLLQALSQAETVSGFEDAFQREVASVTGDDSTCLAAFYGWDGLRKSIRTRLEKIDEMIRFIHAASSTSESDERIRRCWAEYRRETIFDEMKG